MEFEHDAVTSRRYKEDLDGVWPQMEALENKIESLTLLLRECDAALGMLSDMPPVCALRAKITETLQTHNAILKG